jgi:hypothetical protein
MIPPSRDVGDISGASLEFDIVTPTFDIPAQQNSSAGNTDLFSRRGFVQGIGVVSRPIGVGDQAAADAPFSKPGRYYLKLTFEDTASKALYDATGGQPYTSEMAIEVLGSGRDEKAPERKNEIDVTQPGQPEEPPAPALLTGVGGGLAVLGFAGGAVVLWRRRR